MRYIPHLGTDRQIDTVQRDRRRGLGRECVRRWTAIIRSKLLILDAIQDMHDWLSALIPCSMFLLLFSVDVDISLVAYILLSQLEQTQFVPFVPLLARLGSLSSSSSSLLHYLDTLSLSSSASSHTCLHQLLLLLLSSKCLFFFSFSSIVIYLVALCSSSWILDQSC